MSGHHSCMQMLQLFDIPNMQGRVIQVQSQNIFKKSRKKNTYYHQTNQSPEKNDKNSVKLTHLISRIFLPHQ